MEEEKEEEERSFFSRKLPPERGKVLIGFVSFKQFTNYFEAVFMSIV